MLPTTVLLLAVMQFSNLTIDMEDDYRQAQVAWLESSEMMSYNQLITTSFTEELPALKAKTYYYVKIERSGSLNGLALLLCDAFFDVRYVGQDSVVSVDQAQWSKNAHPTVIHFPDSSNNEEYIYLRCYNYQYRTFPWFGFYWMSESYFHQEFHLVEDNYVIEQVIPNALSTGLMLTFIIFFSALYLSGRTQKVYLYYVFYLIPLLVYLFFRSSYVAYELLPTWVIHVPYLFVFTDFPIQVLFHVAYTAFTFIFLSAKENYPTYYKVGRVVIITGIIYFIALSVGMYMHPYGRSWANSFQLERLFISIFSIWANIYVIIHRKDRIALIVALGSLVFLLGAWGAFFYHMNVMRLGASLEVLFFSLGIGYKLKLERAEKDQVKTALIDQLRETEELQKRYNIELENEVRARSEELVEKAKQVEEAKKQKLKAQLENQVEEMKMIAIRSQMNPHFLFNALNSIRALIINDRSTDAYKYLTKFSKLIRKILENSDRNSISLEEELNVAELYVSLEQMRFDEDFSFQMQTDAEIDLSTVRVPPLLLQPFLENSIIHGLGPKERGEKWIKVIISPAKVGMIECRIVDNGVGRAAAGKFRPNDGNHKPMAIELTSKRLLHIDPGLQVDNPISIVDLKDEADKPTGTEVKLLIPYQEHG